MDRLVMRGQAALGLAGLVSLAGCMGTSDAEPVESAPAAADSAFGPDLGARAARFVELALDEGQAHAMLRSLCETAPARLSGSQNADRAVAWGLTTMREIGLSNVRTEP
ncbi:MAG: hypothetical protein ACO3UM_11105, partial [Planctomycetota bacterium]